MNPFICFIDSVILDLYPIYVPLSYDLQYILIQHDYVAFVNFFFYLSS